MIKIKIFNPVAGKNRISFQGFVAMRDMLRDYSIELTESDDFDYAFLGAWNFKKEIFKKEKKFLRKGGRFITHVPEIKIL